MNASLFIQGLNAISEKLKEDKDVELIDFTIEQPANQLLIDHIRQTYFCNRNDPFLDFYQQANGVRLIWTFKSDHAEYVDLHPLIFLKRDIKFAGVINFLPIEMVFDESLWRDTVWFDDDSERNVKFIEDELPNNRIKKRLAPFDYFSVDMSMALFPTCNNAYILLLQDYHIDYTNSLITSFDDYLDFVLQTKGFVKSRYKAFGELNGYKKNHVSVNELISKAGY